MEPKTRQLTPCRGRSRKAVTIAGTHLWAPGAECWVHSCLLYVKTLSYLC